MALDITSYLLGKSKGGGGGSATLITKNISENGTYNAKNDDADGYSKVIVNVEAPAINLQNKEVTITQNGETTITSDIGYDGLGEVQVTTNVPSGGADLSDYFTSTISSGSSSDPGITDMIKTIPSTTTVSGTSLTYAFAKCEQLTTIPLIDTSNVTNMSSMFRQCINLTTIPLLDTSNVTNMSTMFYNCSSLTEIPLLSTANVTTMESMFNSCSSLTTIPLLDTSKVTNMNSMLSGCYNLTDASLDNILQMCINSLETNKTLGRLNFSSVYYPASRIQALPHYQDFINAGWSIGY